MLDLMLCGCDLDKSFKEEHNLWGLWVAQSVKRLTLDFSSGRDLTVHGIKSHVELSAECGTCLVCLPLFLSLSLSINILKNVLKKKKNEYDF